MLNKDNDNSQYIEGDSRVRLVMFGLLGFWGLIGFLLKQIAENKIEHIKATKNLTAAMSNLNDVFIYYLVIPVSFFCTIQGLYFMRLGFKTLNAGIYPPPGVKVPFKTRIQRGILAKLSALGCFFAGTCNFAVIAILIIMRHKLFKHI